MAVVIKVGETEAVSVDIGEKVYIQGDPGFSPVIDVTEVTGGHRVTVTDVAGEQSFLVMNGERGEPGPPGEVTQAEFDALAEDVAENTQELTDHKSHINGLTALVGRKAGMLVDTASGAVASFVPDATIDNLLGVSVAVEPVQDLHGYESPWPAGGGKNKWQNGAIASDWSNNGSLTRIEEETLYFEIRGSGLTVAYNLTHYPGGKTYTISYTASEQYNRIFVRLRSNDDSRWLTSSDTTISGLTYNGSYGGWWAQSASLTPSFTASIPDCLYCSFGFGYQTSTVGNVETITKIQIEEDSTATAWTPYSNICPISGRDSVNIMHSGADTSDPTTYTIQIGQNIYGGTLDVTNGTMTVDRRFITLDGVNKKVTFGYGALGPQRLPIVFLNNQEKAINQTDYDHIRSSYLKTGNFMNAENSIGVGNGGNALPVHIGTIQGTDGTHGYNSDAELIAAANAYLQEHPLQICYKLATPLLAIQLDPVTIAAITGQTNNVWSDAGDTTVEYAADLKTYIDSKIAAAVAALS